MKILNLKFKRVEIPKKKNIGIKIPGNMHICTLCNQNQQTETPHPCSRVMNFTIHYIPQLLNLKKSISLIIKEKLPPHILYMANRISFPEHLNHKLFGSVELRFLHMANITLYTVYG